MKRLIFSNRKAHIIGARIAKWYFDRYVRRRYSPLIVAIFTTNLCNLKCDICSIWRGAPKASISLQQLKDVVDASSKSACYISFSGGEPLMVSDIIEMVSYASSRIPYTHMVSNGLLVTPDIVRQLARAGLTEISLSLDGDPSWHNKVRGSQKSYDAVINAIDCFKTEAPDMHVVVNTVIYPEALQETKRAVEISRKMGVLHKVQPVNKHFHFENSSSSPKELSFAGVGRKEVRDLVRYLLDAPNVANSRYFLKNISAYFGGGLICKPAYPKCFLPYFFLEVSAHGNVSPCMYGTGWDGVLHIGPDLAAGLRSEKFMECQKRLEGCRLCDKSMYACYWEPLIQFPLAHSVIYGLSR